MLKPELVDALEDALVERFKKREDYLVALLKGNRGFPYGQEKLTGRDLYDHLIELRATGDPAFYQDPRAAETLLQLEELYGPAPVAVPPYQNPLQQGVIQ